MNERWWTMRWRSRRPARLDDVRELDGRGAPLLPLGRDPPAPAVPVAPDPVFEAPVAPLPPVAPLAPVAPVEVSSIVGPVGCDEVGGGLAGRLVAGFVPGRWRRRLALLTWLPRCRVGG